MITGCLLIFLGFVWTMIKFSVMFGIQMFKFLLCLGCVIAAAVIIMFICWL